SWRFTDRDDHRCIVLATNAVTLQSTLNQTEEFDLVLFDAVSLIQRSVSPDHVQRIGLRYINVIQPDQKALSHYVHAGLLGIPLEQAGAISSAWHFYSVNQTEHGVLILQGRYPMADKFLPPDVSMGPGLKLRPLRDDAASFVLDLDHFAELKAPFELAAVKSTLQKFRSVLEETFRLAVTESALAEWR